MSDGRPAWVYLVECADGSLYAGWCYDVGRRVAEHNAGRASRYTRARLPVALRWREAQPTRRAAMQREIALKAMSRAEKLALIERSDGGER